jgi:prefoldin subunit 5
MNDSKTPGPAIEVLERRITSLEAALETLQASQDKSLAKIDELIRLQRETSEVF